MPRWMRTWLCLLLWCLPLCLWPLLAGAALPETPRFRLIGVAEGLPSSHVVALAHDRAGYLWLATADGLARYDGVGFRVWRNVPGDPQSLPGNTVQALAVDRHDRIWVATEGGGLSVLDAARTHFVHYRMATQPQMGSDDVWALAIGGDSVWAGTYGGGLDRFELDQDGGIARIRRFMPVAGDPHSLPAETVLSVAFDADGALWAGTVHGVARWTGHDFARIDLPGSNPTPLVYSLIRDGDALWVGASSGVFRRDADGQWRTPSWSPMFERPNAMTALVHDDDGRLWIGSQHGLWRTQRDGIPAPVHDNGPGIARVVQALLREDDGALWAPVPGAGLGYLRADWRRLAQFSHRDSQLGGELYRAIAPARDGGVWLATYLGAPERLDADGAVERLPSAVREALASAKLTTIVETGDGVLWTGSRGMLARIGLDGSLRTWTTDSAVDAVLPGLNRLRLADDGSLWLSCNGGGVQRRDAATGKVLDSYPADSHGLGEADIEVLEFDSGGDAWIAGDGGVSRWNPQNETFEHVPAMGDARAYALAFDGPDALWLSRRAGLEHYRRDGAAWQRVETLDADVGVPAVEAAGMRIDRGHRIWVSTTRGLYRWDPATRHLRHFGLQDGLSSQEFEPASITLTEAGVLAATTSDGSVVLVDTTASDLPPARPELRIDEVAIRRDGRWQPVPMADVALAPDERELRVRTRLLAYEDPQANRYASRLEGFDRGWVAQDNGERIFSGLQAGEYTLHLRAVDAAGNRSAEQVLRWRVLPPWWRTAWAMSAFAVLALLLLWWAAAAYRRRLKQRHALQLVQAQRQLAEQASEAKTRFLATLGHEVRTPMTGVLGMSELLLGTALDPQQRGQVESIRRAGNHLLQLVNDALDLARIEAGKLELDARPFDLRELLAEVRGLMAPLAEQRGLGFHVVVADAVPAALLGDRRRVEQILLNLLGNAIKFTERGEVALHVEPLPGAGLRLRVRDTGPGLDAEQRARLFQRFEQADGARTAARYGGSGLGLAISQELAAAMGGRIGVESTPGAGTCFSVELPLPAVDAVPQAVAPGATSARHLRLLLVEDDPTVAEVIAGLLRAQGHTVVHAAHGLAALTEVAAAGFDAGLLDLDLPGMDGLQLARQLRARDVKMPLLAVTARADAAAEPQAREAGFDGFLRKPVTGAMLAEAIEGLYPPSESRQP